MTAPLIELDGVEKRYGFVVALRKLHFRIDAGETPIIAVAGESGSGKTTLAAMLLGFTEPSDGEVRYGGVPVAKLSGAARKTYRREVQAIFQDPFAVYNPFYRVDHALSEPLRAFGLAANREQARTMMRTACEQVGLNPADTLGRFPHQLSGGQRQRLMVARALLLKPKLLVADEPVSMIDASLRAIVLRSLRALNRDHKIPIIYITHDLATAYHVADHILVLYKGEVVEAGSAADVIKAPKHPYTRLLVGSIPWPDLDMRWGQDQPILKDEAPGDRRGCAFAGRCASATDECRTTKPPLYARGTTASRCYLNRGDDALDDSKLSEFLKHQARP
ncbi:MAG: ABC transporter ATP-binding protein [Alphaproteobacteria bacterium]|nr:ABC transporter ATP-binding protein [Alphaproteobacteria bacterium]